MLGDKDLAIYRQKYYSLLVRLLWKEPEPEYVASLREGLAERAESDGELSPLIGEGWRAIDRYLDKNDPAEVADEYTQMYLGPHLPDVTPYESYYLAGSMYQAPLAAVRGFLQEIGLEQKKGEFSEPEDMLAFELEIMNWIISKQLAADSIKGEENWLDLQANFLKRHLLVWGPTCAGDIEKAKHAKFFKGVGKLLRGFLEVETQLFQDRGPEKIESIADARERFGGVGKWKGPLFEPAMPDKSTEKIEN